MSRIGTSRHWLRCAALLVVAAFASAAVVVSVVVVRPRPAASQDAGPAGFSADVTVQVNTDDLASTGTYRIAFQCTSRQEKLAPLSIAVKLASGDATYVEWSTPPEVPSPKWVMGEPVRWEVQAPFPAELLGRDVGEIEIHVGFHDPATGAIHPPRNGHQTRPGFMIVARFSPPDVVAIATEAQIAAVLARGETLAKEGKKPEAWTAFEFGIRNTPTDAAKLRFRDAMLKLGEFAPRPLDGAEHEVVKKRIDDERERYLRQVAGRMWDQGKFHGALRILESIGGKLKEAADAAVVGALNAAERTERDLDDLRKKILTQATPEDKAAAAEALKTLGATQAAFDRANEWARGGRRAAARILLKELLVEGGRALREPCEAALRDLEKAWLSACPPGEATAADAELNHPVFARTVVVPSHEFIFIGPKQLVETIPASSKLAYDVAYVFQTDLFGRRPNPLGDRVTVYFKELWDFGGGVGGGKTIDIGNAKHDAKGLRIDNGLLFHELAHCVDDTVPIHAGFREGLADFATAYTHEVLGRATEANAAFGTAKAAFHKDYLERDLECFRMPNYAPSAGFFLHFVETYGKAAGGGHDWRGYRQFFREYRSAPIRDGREPCIARALAHYLVRAFGPGAFDDLVKFRFPLDPTDREAVEKELDLFKQGDASVATAGDLLAVYPNSQLRRDVAQRRLFEAHRFGNDDDAHRIATQELGIVFDWSVIGPFEPEGTDPMHQVFAPEKSIDFAAEFPYRFNTARWRIPNLKDPQRPVKIDGTGWVDLEFEYMDDTAFYGLTHVTVVQDTDVVFHVRADDDLALWAGGERLDGYVGRGWNDSTALRWRGPVEKAPDAFRFSVRLKKGRTPILLKVKNRSGGAGFVMAVSDRAGRVVGGLRTDTAPPDAGPAKAPAAPRWQNGPRLDFKAKSAAAKLDAVVGAVGSENKFGFGTATAKGVAWRKYTVRPGFPKDSPSNLFWLKAKDTESADDFRLTLQIEKRNESPKLAVTFQGEGNADGLSGWNLLLWNADGKTGGQLERYEDVWYQWTPLARPAAKEHDVLVVQVASNRLTVTMNDAVLLDSVSIRRIPGKHRIGISTWGSDPKFASIDLDVVK